MNKGEGADNSNSTSPPKDCFDPIYPQNRLTQNGSESFVSTPAKGKLQVMCILGVRAKIRRRRRFASKPPLMETNYD